MQFTFIILYNPHTNHMKVVFLFHSFNIYFSVYHIPITACHYSRCEEYNLKAQRLGPCAHGAQRTGENTGSKWL